MSFEISISVFRNFIIFSNKFSDFLPCLIYIYSLYILFQKNLEANDIFHTRGIFIINCSQFASRKVIKIAIFKRNLLNEVNAPSTVIPERTLVSQLTFTYSKSTIELLQKV